MPPFHPIWWRWPLASLRSSPAATAAALVVPAILVAAALSLQGYAEGYGRAVEDEVDRYGFDVLITARGCPYEAATLLLRGGVGMRYMPDSVVPTLSADARVSAAVPMLVHPVRDPSLASGVLLLQGVEIAFAQRQGWSLASGQWFGPDRAGVVLGYEIAELERRVVGDAFLLPGGEGPEAVEVVGILGRTGTQVDGTVLLPLDVLQQRYGLGGRLTGVGLRLVGGDTAVETIRAEYEADPALQVVPMSGVVSNLRQGLQRLDAVVRVLSAAMFAALVLFQFQTALLRGAATRRRVGVLRILGVPASFAIGVCFFEATILAGTSAVLGAGVAIALRGPAERWMAGLLAFTPAGPLIEIDGGRWFLALLSVLVSAIVATAVALVGTRDLGPSAGREP